VRGHRDVAWIGDVRGAGETLAGEALSGDVVLTLGAGNVSAAGDELLRRLRA
jgi:UDP-N-acetylmuramate-alanine ligase